MTIDFFKIIELIKDPDLRMKITQLYGENITLKEENSKLRQKIEKFNKNEEIRSKLQHKDNHYLIEEDGPFCTKCWDVDEKLVRLHGNASDEGVQHFTCPNCKTYTQIGEYPRTRVEDINLY